MISMVKFIYIPATRSDAMVLMIKFNSLVFFVVVNIRPTLQTPVVLFFIVVCN